MGSVCQKGMALSIGHAKAIREVPIQEQLSRQFLRRTPQFTLNMIARFLQLASFIRIQRLKQTLILGSAISGNNKLQILNVYLSKLLSSHSIKLTNTRSHAYEVSLTNINPEVSCYCEWHLEADKLPISSGDKIDLVHVLTGRYLLATELDEEGIVYCGYGSNRCWTIEFEDNILKDGAIFELKHNEITKYLSFLNKKHRCHIIGRFAQMTMRGRTTIGNQF